MSAASILVLGLGNDILTDDAVGLHVADAASRLLEGCAEIEVRKTTEMGLALLDEVADRYGVVLVDSVQTGRQPPGHIHELGAEELGGALTTAPHFLGVGETLALGRKLGLQMPQKVRILAIEVADPYTLGTAMTPGVQAAVPEAAGRAAALARAFSQERSSAGSTRKSGLSRRDRSALIAQGAGKIREGHQPAQ